MSAALWLACLPAAADEAGDAGLVALYEAIDVRGTVEVMAKEGDLYGQQIAEEMLPEADMTSWAAEVRRIYSADRMQRLVEQEMGAALEGTDPAPLVAFFTSELGTQVIALELAGRRAFLDEEIEEAAMVRAENARRAGNETAKQIEEIIADSDLIERNVIGGLNSNLMFYRGLADGGGIEMTEDDMLRDVWFQEDANRAETEDWLYAFLLLAYDPLSAAQLEEYAALFRIPEGRVLNAALFQAYNRMYDEVSYLLGQAVAAHMKSAPL